MCTHITEYKPLLLRLSSRWTSLASGPTAGGTGTTTGSRTATRESSGRPESTTPTTRPRSSSSWLKRAKSPCYRGNKASGSAAWCSSSAEVVVVVVVVCPLAVRNQPQVWLQYNISDFLTSAVGGQLTEDWRTRETERCYVKASFRASKEPVRWTRPCHLHVGLSVQTWTHHCHHIFVRPPLDLAADLGCKGSGFFRATYQM